MTPFASIDITEVVVWLAAIPFEAWPQQHRLSDGKIRPAMVTDPEWHGFGGIVAPIIAKVMEHHLICTSFQHMLSVVMPGHRIDAHRDSQAPYWLCRVHVPLTSNEEAWFITNHRTHHLRPGFAYRINTTAEHAVINDGETPRVHFIMDIRSR